MPASEDDRSLLDNLAQLYQYDFSEFEPIDVGAEGRYGPGDGSSGWIDWQRVFAEPVHHVFLVRVDGRIAGFASVIQGEAFRDRAERGWWMEEFFVMRRYRRRGVGKRVARAIFDRLPGTWEVGQTARNTAAQAFWRTVIGTYSDGRFEEFEMSDPRWYGPVQYFKTT